MGRKLFFIIIASLISIWSWSQNEIKSASYLQWGELKIPINELVNGTNGTIKLSLKEILASANEPLVLVKDGQDAQLKSLFIIISKDKLTSSPSVVSIENYDKKNALNLHGRAFIEKNLKEGERIYFNNLRGKNTEEHFLNIEVAYSKLPLKLNFSLPKIPRDEVFGFQIQEFPNESLKIKLDTSSVETEKIFKTYSKLSKYEIIHVPNFKTTRRYLTPKDRLNINCQKNLNFITNPTIKEIDINLIPEFTAYNEFEIELKWGEMKTTDLRKSFSGSGNDGTFIENSSGQIIRFQDYDKYDLEGALGQRFILSQGYKTYPINRMKVYVIQLNNEANSYLTDDINNQELQKIFQEIDNNTMILFSEIIIEDDVNGLLYFPTSLLFGIR